MDDVLILIKKEWDRIHEKPNDYKKINFEYDFDYNELLKRSIKGDISNELNAIENCKKYGDIYVNRKLIFQICNKKLEKEFDYSIVRGLNAVKRKNIPRPKYSCTIPYDKECDGLYCITQSWIDAMKNKNSLMYPHVYPYELFNEISGKPTILIKQKVKKSWYNWKNSSEILKLKMIHFPSDAFIICVCGRIAINSYPSTLIHAIQQLRNDGINAYLLILGDVYVSNFRLSKFEYNEINKFDWIKSFVVPKKEVLNYYRICDVLASTYRDYCNMVAGSNKIKEFLLCNKPILCSRGTERERELGKDYEGFYECKTCSTVPPLNMTEEFLNNNNTMKKYYKRYF